MRGVVEVLRREAQAPRFFLAYGQSALGTGAAYVALLLVAYKRFHSPWAITLILLADFVPPMLLSPLFGAAVDRWSRRRAAIAADVTRAGAFLAMGFVSDFGATVALALTAGVGTALYKPAVMAALPSVVERDRLPPATALYGALTDVGYTLGPALAAVVLLFAGPETVLAANGVTFVVSAGLLSTLSFGEGRRWPVRQPRDPASLIRETGQGLVALARLRVARTVVLGASTALLVAGMVNVAELLFARQLGAGSAGYSLLVAATGIGIAAGSLAGSSGGSLGRLEGRFLIGLGTFSIGLLAGGASPTLAAALFGFTLAGVGNGLMIVYERLIIQATVPDEMLGRVFGVQTALDGGAFAISYVAAAGLLSVVGPRVPFLLGGLGCALAWIGVMVALRRAQRAPARSELGGDPSAEPLPARAALGGRR